MSSLSEQATLLGHPKALYILFFTEMWERFSYYGMRALLMLYMVQALNYNVARAGSIYGLYTGLVFLTPLVGGYVADRYLGQRRAIWLGGSLMALGHFCMALEPIPFFTVALTLLIVGNGLFKPNISVIVGQLYQPGDARRDSAFSIFYMGINLGGFFSPLVCGTLGQRIGWHWGFGAAGVGMLAGLLIFGWGQKYLGFHGLLPRRSKQQRLHHSIPSPSRAAWSRTEWHRLGVLVILAIFGNIIFWAAFEQAGSSLTLFAEQATRLTVPFWNGTLPSTWFQSANPLLIMLLAPLFSWGWVALSRAGWEPSTPLKFAIGMGLVAAGFGSMVVAGQLYDTQGPVSMLWLITAYFLNTCGELCISPVGLSVVTKLAPARCASMLMGVWFGSMAVANWLGGEWAGRYAHMPKSEFFRVPALTAGAATLVLLLLVKPLRKLMHGVH